jgi:hypothetical protein
MDDSAVPSAARFFPTVIAVAMDLKLPEIPIQFSTHPTKTNPQNAQNTRPKISQICQKKDPILLSLSPADLICLSSPIPNLKLKASAFN